MIDLNDSDSYHIARNFKSKREILANISWETDIFNIYNPVYSDESIDSECLGLVDETLGQLPVQPVIEDNQNKVSLDSDLFRSKLMFNRDNLIMGDFEDPEIIDTSSFNNELKFLGSGIIQ